MFWVQRCGKNGRKAKTVRVLGFDVRLLEAVQVRRQVAEQNLNPWA